MQIDLHGEVPFTSSYILDLALNGNRKASVLQVYWPCEAEHPHASPQSLNLSGPGVNQFVFPYTISSTVERSLKICQFSLNLLLKDTKHLTGLLKTRRYLKDQSAM